MGTDGFDTFETSPSFDHKLISKSSSECQWAILMLVRQISPGKPKYWFRHCKVHRGLLQQPPHTVNDYFLFVLAPCKTFLIGQISKDRGKNGNLGPGSHLGKEEGAFGLWTRLRGVVLVALYVIVCDWSCNRKRMSMTNMIARKRVSSMI